MKTTVFLSFCAFVVLAEALTIPETITDIPEESGTLTSKTEETDATEPNTEEALKEEWTTKEGVEEEFSTEKQVKDSIKHFLGVAEDITEKTDINEVSTDEISREELSTEEAIKELNADIASREEISTNIITKDEVENENVNNLLYVTPEKGEPLRLYEKEENLKLHINGTIFADTLSLLSTVKNLTISHSFIENIEPSALCLENLENLTLFSNYKLPIITKEMLGNCDNLKVFTILEENIDNLNELIGNFSNLFKVELKIRFV